MTSKIKRIEGFINEADALIRKMHNQDITVAERAALLDILEGKRKLVSARNFWKKEATKEIAAEEGAKAGTIAHVGDRGVTVIANYEHKEI